MNECFLPREFYDLIAESYDERYHEHVNIFMTRKQASFLEQYLKKDFLILDVACGTGRHSIELTRKGYQVVGLDISRKVIKLAHVKAGDLRIDFVQGDMVSLPFLDSSFDTIICMWNSLQEVMGKTNRIKASQEIHRILKKGGTAVLDFPNPTWADRSLEELEKKCKWPEGEERDYFFTEKVNDRTVKVYMHYFSHKEIDEILKKAKFKEIHRYGDYSANAEFLPNESEKLIIVAEKI